MNWKKIIADIQAKHQLTQCQIAEKCGCGQATISELARGVTKEPGHSLGESLKALLSTRKAKRV